MSNSHIAVESQVGEGVDEATQLTNHRSKKRSRVWEFFRELLEEGKAICIYCQKNCHIISGLACHT
jgi:hypothetical protein